MRKITTIPYDEQNTRVETGALQINDDWKGLFVRGDDCIYLAKILKKVHKAEILDMFELGFLTSIRPYIQQEVLN
jgi:hypothetical protein